MYKYVSMSKGRQIITTCHKYKFGVCWAHSVCCTYYTKVQRSSQYPNTAYVNKSGLEFNNLYRQNGMGKLNLFSFKCMLKSNLLNVISIYFGVVQFVVKKKECKSWWW